MTGCDFITKVDMRAGFHSMRMSMGQEKFTAFRMTFGLYEYIVLPFGLTNAPATCQREINRILQPLLGVKLRIDTKVAIDDDVGMIVVAYIDDIFNATKGSWEKQHKQVSKVFQLLMDNHMCIEINKCIFDPKEVPFLRFIVSGSDLRMEPDMANAIVNWPRRTNKKEVQQLLGLRNFYRRFGSGYAAIAAPITDPLHGNNRDII